MCIHLKFNYKKAAQMLNLLAVKSGGEINKMKALKLVFIADRYHLRKYGRPITNDEYFAMPYGPVASGVKDIAEQSGFLSDAEMAYAAEYFETIDKYSYKSKKPVNDVVFSESDLGAVSFAWDSFGHMDQFELAVITHNLPEWKKHENELKYNSRLRMSYEDFFDNPSAGEEWTDEITREDKDDYIEHLKEASAIESLWS